MKAEIWHGTNNRFLVVLDNERTLLKTPKTIQKITQKFKVDGFIGIYVKNKKTIFMDFFNPDGTLDNCGNGLRVATSFCYSKKLIAKRGNVISRGLIFKYKINKKDVSITFRNIETNGLFFIIGSVKHKVINVNDFEKSKKIAQKIRKKENCNITLVKKINNTIFAQTFEVGVENFTYSCGTGAIAAAIMTKKETIFMPGGLLKIKKTKEGLNLSGKTKYVKEVKLWNLTPR